MRKAILAVLFLVGCGGTMDVLPDGGPPPGDSGAIPCTDPHHPCVSDAGTIPEQPEVTLTWNEVNASACGNSLVTCSKGLATDAGFRDSLVATYSTPNCSVSWDGSHIQAYIYCDLNGYTPGHACTSASCGGGSQWTCPSVPNTGPGCSWTP